ncbi:MAG: hypothetical protein FH756_10785 [Firmicutes bacterium]|nr:hypothetical protein [Bacillota bacterium]
MKELIRNILKDQRGVSPLMLLIIFLPLLIFTTTYSVTTTQGVTTYDIDLQNAVEVSARAAAQQVTDDSQASGTPRIHTANAHTIFRQELARNMGLNEADLTPLAGSNIGQPNYVFIVYNTDVTFAASGAELAQKYVFSYGSLTNSALFPAGNPTSFVVSDTDITLGDVGAITTTLEKPAVVAVVNADMKRAIGTDPVNMSRWMAVRLHY